MKKWFIHILLLAGLFGMLTTSCSQDEALEQTGTTNGTVRIQFTLAMDGNAGSRAAADWGTETGGTENSPATDNRVAGDSYENMINLDQLQVFLFQGNKYLGEVGNLSLEDVSGATNKNKYTFRGEVIVSNATITNNKLQNATIMVVANYEGYVNGNLAITQNYIFDYIASAYNASAQNMKYIPMWGMLKPESGIPLNKSTDDTFTPIGNIYMLRSLAKIEVLMAANDFTLEGAKLNKYNTKAKLLPSKPTNGYFSATSTSDYDTENCMNDEVSAVTSELSFFETSTGSYVIYVPEYNNYSKDIEITLDIAKDGKSISGDLDSEGKFKLATSSIVRNHWYKCTVNSVDYNTGFDLTLAVAPWAYVDETFSYESNLSYNDGIWTNYASIEDTDTDNTDNTDDTGNTGKTVVLKTGSDANVNTTAEYSFEINTPLTIEWMAVLEDPYMKFEFDMKKTSGTGTVTGENAVQRTVKGELLVTGSNLTLGVKAVNPGEKGQFDAKLRVYVTYNGKTIELDLVDGIESALQHFTIRHSSL